MGITFHVWLFAQGTILQQILKMLLHKQGCLHNASNAILMFEGSTPNSVYYQLNCHCPSRINQVYKTCCLHGWLQQCLGQTKNTKDW